MGNKQTKQQSLPENTESKQQIPDSDRGRLDAELKEKTLEEKDIEEIIEKAKKKANVNNPFIICISTKENYNVFSEQKSNDDIVVIEGSTHKHIKQELTSIINKFDKSYDAIVVVPIGICFVGETNSIKFFYDKEGAPRHIEKIKKDIVYRLDEPAVLIDCRKAVIFPIKDMDKDDDVKEADAPLTQKTRPADQMEHIPTDMQLWKSYDAMEKKSTQPVLQTVVKDQGTKPQFHDDGKEEETIDGVE